MKNVAEYIITHPQAEVCNALNKANANPHLVRRIVEIYRQSGYELKSSENPYAEETRNLNITSKDARILADYYEYCDEIERREEKAYKKAYPHADCFYDGVKPFIDMKAYGLS